MDALILTNWSWFFHAALPWLMPLFAGLLILGGGIFLKKYRHEIIFGTALLSLLLSFVLSWNGWLHGTAETGNMFVFDSFSYLFSLLLALAGFLVLLLSYSYCQEMIKEHPEYYTLILFAIFGMNCMAAGADLVLVFIGLEVMSIAVYILAGFHREKRTSIEAALKYFLTGAFASGFLLMGIAFLYGATGTTDLHELYKQGAGLLAEQHRWFALIGYSLVVIGIAFKIALAPFHFWAADVYEGAPVSVTAFMASAVKVAAVAALLRLSWAIFQWEPEYFNALVWVGAVLTMTIGNLGALLQSNLKRMLAYSSIAHAGYLIVPLAVYGAEPKLAASSMLFYLTAYVLMTLGAFALLVAMTGEGKERPGVHELVGLGKNKPFLAFAFAFFMFSLAGFPPTMGFFGKYYLFTTAVKGGEVALVVIALINSVVSVYYYLRPVVYMYFGTVEESKKAYQPKLAYNILIVLLVSLLAVGYFGLFPNQLMDLISQSAAFVAVK